MHYYVHKNTNTISRNINNNNNLKFKTFYALSDSGNINSVISDKNNSLFFLNKNNYKKEYKYGKLYFHSKEKLFMKEIKKYKDNRRIINSNKMNRFHKMFILNKMKSFSESPDGNDFNSNNKTTTYSETTSNNFSKKLKNKYAIMSNKNHLKNNNSIKVRNNNFILNNNYLKTDNDIISLNQCPTNRHHVIIQTANYKRNDDLTINNSLNKTKKMYNFYDNNKAYQSPTKILNYKFNDAIGNIDNNVYCEGKLTSSRGLRNGLTEQILSKFRFNVINKIKKEFYETKFEIQQDPLSIMKEYKIFLEKNKQYYNIYQVLIKKYFGYLYSQIDEEKYKLIVLKEEREKIKEENFQITKKINIQNEKLVFYQNFMKLLLKIKYNTSSLSFISEENLKKYGIKISTNHRLLKKNTFVLLTEIKTQNKPQLKRKATINYNLNKKFFFQRTRSNNYDYFLKNNKDISQESNSSSKKNNNYYIRHTTTEKKTKTSEPPKVPIFNDVEELFEKLKGIDNHLKEMHKESVDKRYMIKLLKNDLYKEKSRNKQDKNIKINNKELIILKEKLIKTKAKYEIYLNFRNYLYSIKDSNYIEYKPEIDLDEHNDNNINEKNKDDKNHYEKKKKEHFADKLISIILKLNINVEKFTDIKGVYIFLKNPQEIKINSQGKEYMKIIFCIKILEILFLKLMEKRREYLLDNKTRQKYIEYEEALDKHNKIMKVCEKREEEFNQRIKREREILMKSSKIPFVQRKKDDPFSFNIYYEKIKKTEKERIKKIKKDEEMENTFKNFISY